MKRVWNYIVTMWQPASAFIIGSVIIAALFAYQIGSLVPGSAAVETNTKVSSESVQNILENPVNAPYKFAQYTVQHINKGVDAQRLVSGLAAGITIVLFYLLARRFCSTYAAWLATALYATSSSLLHNGRLISPQVTLLLLFVLFACGYHLRFSKKRTRSWLVSAAALGIALYTPGLLYFVIGGIIWQYKTIRKAKDKPTPAVIATCAAVVLVLLIPLILGFVREPSLWHEYLGIPTAWPGLSKLLINIVAVPAGLFLLAPENPVYRLGHQPLLDIFATTAFILGCYKLLKQRRLDRAVLLGGLFILATLFTAVTGNYENSFILVPFVYLVVGIGLSYLLDEWNKIFPLNPLARWVALIVISLAVIISCNFQTRRYFIAWPHNAVTRSVFSQK